MAWTTSKCVLEDTPLKIPEEFSFPFQPYQIQVDFMKALFSALDNKRLGIFESPTGTGKSLSLLCGSLTWLEQREAQRLKDLKSLVVSCNIEREEKVAKEAENWIAAQHAYLQKKERVFKATRELQFMEKLMENRKKCLERKKLLGKTLPMHFSKENKPVKEAATESSAVDPIDELTTLLLDDEFAPETVSDTEFSDDEGDEKEAEFHPLKVIFASRTHSQLSQFVNELKKTEFAAKITTASLGSRQTLCVNPEVTRVKSLSLINERCLDLQKNSKGKKTKEGKKQKTCSGCPYFNQTAIEDLKNQILCEPIDIEELVKVGRKMKACPYYASRKASKEAQLVLLPYNTILHSSTREGIGLRTENSAIILDEAHNLIEAMSNMYSTQVTLTQLQESLKGLKTYMNRYMSRFNPKNLLKLKQIAHILKSFTVFLGNGEAPRVFYVLEFVAVSGVEKLDLYELFRYMTKSKLMFKLKGYLQLQEKQRLLEAATSNNPTAEPEAGNQGSSSGQAVLNFFEFLRSITKSCASGRIIRDGQSLKFLLLNTADRFSDIVNSARSIILAGGTMKPYEDVQDQLFYGSKDRIVSFSCSHVIPDENLICLALSHGASVPFDFTFKSRSSPQLLQDLSGAVLNFSRIVPGGLVIFLPSYDYEETFHSHLKQSGILGKIEAKKRLFREPKQSNCDKVLSDYSRQIRNNPGGAILLAVVGGKLSEGINFSDDLGRCVIVVGLPYPNITSMEIKQKVQFVSDKFGAEKGKQLLTNACFKAVNQSIGRAIRHANDYAAIILLDARFLSTDSQAQLPDWIRKKYERCTSLGADMGLRHALFISRTVLVQNNDVDAAMRLLNRIMGREGMFDQYRRTRRYEKPFQTRRRVNYEKCKAIYNEDMARKVQFIMRKNRVNPYPGCF